MIADKKTSCQLSNKIDSLLIVFRDVTIDQNTPQIQKIQPELENLKIQLELSMKLLDDIIFSKE